jgi:hypothetical protein
MRADFINREWFSDFVLFVDQKIAEIADLLDGVECILRDSTPRRDR